MKERLPYISGIRCIAFLTVAITHFLENECSEVFKYWDVGTYNVGWILAIFKGKIGVTIFCVTSGFLAALAVNKKRADIADSAVKRYIRFGSNLLIVNVIYFLSQKYACILT